MYAVYKYVYDGEIIYIGQVSTDLHRRIVQHANEKAFKEYKNAEIYYAELLNQAETNVYETVLINNYRPILNKSMKPDIARRINLDMSVLEWTKYELPIGKNRIEIAIQKWNERQRMPINDFEDLENEREYESLMHRLEVNRLKENKSRRTNRKKGSGGYVDIRGRIYFRLRKTINGEVKTFYGKTESEARAKHNEYISASNLDTDS